MAEAEEACLGLAVARDADKGEALDEEIGVVAAALGEETVDGGTAREAVQLVWLLLLFHLVLGFEHGPRRGDRGDG